MNRTRAVWLPTLRGRATPALRAAVLRQLVAAGVEVAGLSERREGLEELFLKVAGSFPGGGASFAPETLRALLGGEAGIADVRVSDGITIATRSPRRA